MTSAVLILCGLCFFALAVKLWQADLNLGLTFFVRVCSIFVALELAGYFFRWPDAVRLSFSAVTLAIILVGTYQRFKNGFHGSLPGNVATKA